MSIDYYNLGGYYAAECDRMDRPGRHPSARSLDRALDGKDESLPEFLTRIWKAGWRVTPKRGSWLCPDCAKRYRFTWAKRQLPRIKSARYRRRTRVIPRRQPTSNSTAVFLGGLAGAFVMSLFGKSKP